MNRTYEIAPDSIGNPALQASLATLNELGVHAYMGLDEPTRQAITKASQQRHIVEFCPNDKKRFGTPDAADKWQAKGRGLITFWRDGLLNYEWAGMEPNRHLPDYPVTTAYRVTTAGAALNAEMREDNPTFSLALTAAQLLLHYSVRTWGTSRAEISLETWNSNKRAGRLYEKLGFRDAALGSWEPRPSLGASDSLQSPQITRRVCDRRRFMYLDPVLAPYL